MQRYNVIKKYYNLMTFIICCLSPIAGNYNVT